MHNIRVRPVPQFGFACKCLLNRPRSVSRVPTDEDGDREQRRRRLRNQTPSLTTKKSDEGDER